MTFGEKLQKLRAREGLSQDALAELLNVSRQAVSRWERDETMPETEKVVRISDHFHVTTDYLLKDGPEHFPPGLPAPAGSGGRVAEVRLSAGLGLGPVGSDGVSPDAPCGRHSLWDR